MKKKFKRIGSYFVYILECQDGTYYTGYTNNLSNRINRHNKGIASKYTQRRLPVRLVCCKEYKYFKKAFNRERAIKKFTRKQKENKKQRNFERCSKNLLSLQGVMFLEPKSGTTPKGLYAKTFGCQKSGPGALSPVKSLPKGRHFSTAPQTRHPKVFVKTFGCPLASL